MQTGCLYIPCSLLSPASVFAKVTNLSEFEGCPEMYFSMIKNKETVRRSLDKLLKTKCSNTQTCTHTHPQTTVSQRESETA